MFWLKAILASLRTVAKLGLVRRRLEWHLPDRTLPYWRGRIVEARYESG